MGGGRIHLGTRMTLNHWGGGGRKEGVDRMERGGEGETGAVKLFLRHLNFTAFRFV